MGDSIDYKALEMGDVSKRILYRIFQSFFTVTISRSERALSE